MLAIVVELPVAGVGVLPPLRRVDADAGDDERLGIDRQDMGNLRVGAGVVGVLALPAPWHHDGHGADVKVSRRPERQQLVGGRGLPTVHGPRRILVDRLDLDPTRFGRAQPDGERVGLALLDADELVDVYLVVDGAGAGDAHPEAALALPRGFGERVLRGGPGRGVQEVPPRVGQGFALEVPAFKEVARERVIERALEEARVIHEPVADRRDVPDV